jgi:hypothetical protein
MNEQIPGGEAPAPVEEAPAVETPEQPQEVSSAPDAEPQADTEAPRKQDLPPVQKRIDQLTWKAHEAERRLNAEIMRRQQVEDEARQLRTQQQELMRRATMPTMDQVGLDPEAYQQAVMAHNEKWLQYQREQEQQAQQRAYQSSQAQQFEQVLNARVAEGQQKYPDYAEVVGNPQLPPLASVNPALLAAIIGHEQMPEITYYLGKNPADAHRIAQLPPARAILEVGKIAAKLQANPPRSSNAPPPPSQVSGGSATVKKDPSQMSYDEFVAYRRKQIAARR